MNDLTQIEKLSAFKAASQFLKAYYLEQESDELRFVLSGMLIGPSGFAEDANTMYTWAESLAAEHSVNVDEYHDSKRPDYPLASTGDWYKALYRYVKYFRRTDDSEQFNRILKDLQSADFSDRAKLDVDPTWIAWLRCCSENSTEGLVS